MDYFAQQLINGIVLGSIYGLIAIGYTMVYGIVGMINFAHGDIFMIGGFIALITFLILVSIGLSVVPVILLIVLLVSMAITALYGWTIERIAYRPGKFLSADLDKASEDNERNGVVIATTGARIGIVQIAGLVARRIVSFVKQGQAVGAGERFGLIRFGSRVDVYLPEGTRPLVAEGQTSLAGETIIADLKTSDSARNYRIG